MREALGTGADERWPTVIRMSLRYDTVGRLGQPSKKLITRGFEPHRRLSLVK